MFQKKSTKQTRVHCERSACDKKVLHKLFIKILCYVWRGDAAAFYIGYKGTCLVEDVGRFVETDNA